MQQDIMKGVRVPPELHGVQSRPLEEYVRARLLQFAHALAGRLAPQLSSAMVQTAAFDAMQTLPPPDYGSVALEARDLQLVFRHDCLSLGCLDAQCVLCEHNPHRRCSVNFAGKYLVNDILKAKCEAPIRVEVIDRTTGQPVTEGLPEVSLEMSILDGNSYDNKVVESGEEREDDLDSCALLLNNKGQPLLVAGPGGTHNSQSRVVVPLVKGAAILPDLHVSDSSEALLSGRKPPFRLLVRAMHSGGQQVSVRHCVSEGFVVATRRTRTAGKVEIPNVDDHVSKLEHMGKETVKKLQDLRCSAQQAGVDISVPDNTINKVGEFRKLALLAEADGHLRQKLQQVLKLSKEKWDEARDHALKAVVADNRMRIWYADKQNMEVGLLFTCRLGNVDLERPVGLLTKKSQEGAQTTMEATLMAQQTPTQRDQVRQLQPQAVAAWWQAGHPGWAIYPVDSEQFMSTGALDSVNLPTPDHLHAASPMVPPSPTTIQGPPAGSPAPMPPPFNPALASAFGLGPHGPPGDAMLRALSPYMPGTGPPGGNPFFGHPQLLTAQPAHPDRGGASASLGSLASLGGSGNVMGPPQSMPGSGGAGRASVPAPSSSLATHPLDLMPPPQLNGTTASMPSSSGVTSPFAMPPPLPPTSKGTPLDSAFSLGHLSSLFGGDLSKFPQLAGQLAGFPSIPQLSLQGGISADLEQLLQQHAAAAAAAGGGPTAPGGPEAGGSGGSGGGGSTGGLLGPVGRGLSLNIGKLGSLDLPGGDPAMTAALLNDLNPDSLQKATAGGGQDLARMLQGKPSMGLETMQSIENALDNLEGKGEELGAKGGTAAQTAAAVMDEVARNEERRRQLAGQKRK